MAVIDGRTNAVTRRISGAFGSPVEVAADTATDTVYAAYNGGAANSVAVINAAANVITKTIRLATHPEGIAADPATHMFYVANYVPTVSACSGVTNDITSTISVSGPPADVAVNPLTGTVYATTTISSSDMALIDEATDRVTGVIPLEDIARVAADPATDSLVATSPGLDTVYVVQLQHPVIQSGSHARFAVGFHTAFAIEARGTPAPAFSETGTLPAGITLSRQGVLSGTPRPGNGGIHRFTVTASNGVSPAAALAFTLTVDQAPGFTSRSHVTFTAGLRNRFTVRTSGYPASRITEKGALPPGVRFGAERNGTAVIAGTPAASARGRTFMIRITASNGVGQPAVQRFTITVR